MARIRSEIECYETDGREVPLGKHPRPSIVLESHWNRREMIVLKIGDRSWTVLASELEACIRNATNTGRI